MKEILEEARRKSGSNGGGPSSRGSRPVRRSEMVFRDIALACLIGLAFAQNGLSTWAAALLGLLVWMLL